MLKISSKRTFEQYTKQEVQESPCKKQKQEVPSDQPLTNKTKKSTKKNQKSRFSLAEVKTIVANALENQEKELRAEYDKTLRECLDEQFITFTRFNLDHVSRSMPQRSFSYTS
eukprot:TRINITY_DN9169_c0_g1_i2.p1 TRINITY_DN9169_c0_g1~~TRINITY_DN9169_c0_g1_i2.p1  ORF type:complete len:113 (-),score=26.66 TRINITY_DN9169_c0_g1_i2:112-450(-)